MTTFAHGDAPSSHSDLADCETEVEDLRAALQTRPVIDQAKGILIAETGCTTDEAFGMLSTASQRANRKVRDIAASIVEGAQGDSKAS